MRFERLLIHRCSLIGKGKVVGRDPYGRDIVEDDIKEDVPCRFDEVRQALSLDSNGNDFIYENVLYFGEVDINLSTEIKDIRDLHGNIILEGSYSIFRLVPIYKRANFHHWEATVKRK